MIDYLVEATAGHELLNFMDAYSGYDQIKMHPQMKTRMLLLLVRELQGDALRTQKHWSHLQRMVDKVFKDLIERTMKVYVDNMLVKSVLRTDHLQHLGEAFDLLRKHKVKLNPEKCTFRVTSGSFYGI